MALTLEALFNKQSDSIFRNAVAAACWKHAKTLIAGGTPTTPELTQAVELLSFAAPTKYVIAVAVIIDDGVSDDAAISAAVVTAATKLLALIT